MKTFLSWSGNKSHKIAEAFSDWLPCVIQAVEPWVSSKDIERGSIWFNEILEQLKDTNFGIVFVTKENQDKPWLMFESGALSKGLTENRICTVLIDLNVRDIDAGSPLRQINHTTLDKESILRLIKTINSHLEQGQIQEKILERSFNALWDELEKKFEDILNEEPTSAEPDRKDDDVLNDILDNVLNINRKISRVVHKEQSSYIKPLHAKTLLKNLVSMDLNRNEIKDIVEDFIPRKWLSERLDEYFPDEEDDI